MFACSSPRISRSIRATLPVCIFAIACLIALTSHAQAQPKSFSLPNAPDAMVAPAAGEVWRRGTISAVDAKTNSLTLNATFGMAAGAEAKALAPQQKIEVAVAAQTPIFPRGDANWKLPIDGLGPGDEIMVAGAETGGKLTARVIEAARREGKFPVDYFVAQDGDDNNDGSPLAPFRTIAAALEAMPNGNENLSRVLHIGPGDFAESSDGTLGQLLLTDRSYLILTGAGAKTEGGTLITTGDYLKKNHSGVLKLKNSVGIDILNLSIGDERPWDDNVFFESTVHLEDGSNAVLESVEIVGPAFTVMRDRGLKRAPTAVRCVGDGDELTLRNALVSGHGSFISNSRGKVFSRNVTFADMGGFDQDDQFLFMQIPDGQPRNEPRFTFDNCIIYQLEGGIKKRQAMLSFGGPFGGSGESKVFFNPPETETSGNILVRGRLDSKGNFIQTSDLPRSFNLIDGKYTIAHGIYAQDDVLATRLGGIRVDNELNLDDKTGYPLIAVAPLQSGWRGGLTNPISSPIDGIQ